MRTASIPYSVIGADVADIQEALTIMLGKSELPGIADGATDGRLLWTFEEDAVRFYWQTLPTDSNSTETSE